MQCDPSLKSARRPGGSDFGARGVKGSRCGRPTSARGAVGVKPHALLVEMLLQQCLHRKDAGPAALGCARRTAHRAHGPGALGQYGVDIAVRDHAALANDHDDRLAIPKSMAVIHLTSRHDLVAGAVFAASGGSRRVHDHRYADQADEGSGHVVAVGPEAVECHAPDQ